jgi:type IV secretory pathway VirB10-like protein
MRSIPALSSQPLSARARAVFALVLASLTLLAALPADAQWKWRDKDGRITVSDRPPPREVPEKDILGRPNTAAQRAQAAAAAAPAAGTAIAAQASAPVTALEREVQARRRAAEEDKAAKMKAEEERNAARRAENCRNARNHLAALDSGQRIARMNDKGEREVLDDAARAQEAQRAREVIASDCR